MKYRIHIGSLEDDGHSVGRTVLKLALEEDGYEVVDSGVDNRLKDFGWKEVDAILISSMNGHALEHITGMESLLEKIEDRYGKRPLYIGGNLGADNFEEVKQELERQGFDRVFGPNTNVDAVLNALKEDLKDKEPVPKKEYNPRGWEDTGLIRANRSNNRLGEGFYRDMLKELEYLHGVPDLESILDGQSHVSTRFSQVLQRAKKNGQVLLHPRSGASSYEEMREIWQQLADKADCLSIQVDSLTRKHYFEKVRDAVKHRRRLNGWPATHLQYDSKRLVREFSEMPLQVRHGSADPRFLAAATLAQGFTSFEGGAISYNFPYFNIKPLSNSIRHWQQTDRLCGRLTELGFPINREFFGPLTGTLIEPSIAISVNILEALLAAEQGVKDMALGYAEQGNRSQDIAAMRLLEPMTQKYLQQYWYSDISLSTVFHQYMGAFPTDSEKANQLITASGTTAKLANATRIMTKSYEEAQNIPDAYRNLLGLMAAKEGIETDAQENEERVEYEMRLIKREVKAILKKVLDCPIDDFAKNIVIAFDQGYLDIPFSPSRYNRGEVITVRDENGAVRFADVGNMPFSRDLRNIHRDLTQPRIDQFGSMAQLVIYDVTRIPKNDFETWPLDT